MYATEAISVGHKKEDSTPRERVVAKLWYDYLQLDRPKESVDRYARMIARDVGEDGSILPPVVERPKGNSKHEQDKFMSHKLLKYNSGKECGEDGREKILEDLKKVRDTIYRMGL